MIGPLMFAMFTAAYGILTASVWLGASGAAIGETTGYGAKRGALIGAHVGAAARTVYQVTRQ